MIKVFFRNVNDDTGFLLGEFVPSEIDSIVSLVEEHGMFIEDEISSDRYEYFGAQFVLRDGHRAFEIIGEETK